MHSHSINGFPYLNYEDLVLVASMVHPHSIDYIAPKKIWKYIQVYETHVGKKHTHMNCGSRHTQKVQRTDKTQQ